MVILRGSQGSISRAKRGSSDAIWEVLGPSGVFFFPSRGFACKFGVAGIVLVVSGSAPWRFWVGLGGFAGPWGESWRVVWQSLGGFWGFSKPKASVTARLPNMSKTDGKTTVLRDPALHLEVVGVLWERFLGGSGRSLEATWEVLGPTWAFFLPSRGSRVPCLRS